MNNINITLNKNEVTNMYEDNFKQIKNLKKDQEAKIDEANKLDNQVSKLASKIRKLRIIKNTGNDSFSYTILCYCGVPYNTKKDPDAIIREERPQCPHCKIRVETKK